MSDFYLDKNLTKPGENLNINSTGACINSWVFLSDNTEVANIITTSSWTQAVHVVSIGESHISDTSGNCSNSWAILLVSTEDWLQPFMTKKSFDEFTNYELIFVFATILIIFILNIWKL